MILDDHADPEAQPIETVRDIREDRTHRVTTPLRELDPPIRKNRR